MAQEQIKKVKITASSLSIRKDASSDSESIGALSKGNEVGYTSEKNGFYYLPTYRGYIDSSYTTKPIEDNTATVTSTVTGAVSSIIKKEDTDAEVNKLLTKNIHGIHAIPYQFMPSVDRRLDGTQLGRKYAEKIVGRMPLLFLSPGTQAFMSEFKNNDKRSVIGDLTSILGGDSLDGGLNDILNDEGRYYTFKYDYKTYYKYVDAMANSVAVLLGIGDKEMSIGGHRRAKLKDYRWENVANSDFSSYFSAAENVIFYINASSTINESFSNETRESSLASSINGISDTAKELQFLLGSDFTSKVVTANEGAINTVMSGVNSIIDNYLNGGGVLKSITEGGINSVLSGGKIIFPELWSDSDYSTSYDIDIKLRSPDHDNLSIYLNCIIPYIHLLALTAPQSITTNSYSAPFLVRAFYKGSYNIDMGLITSLSVTKGAEGAWNDTGLPTQMDISMTIKDLYSSFTISTAENEKYTVPQIVKNTALVDYLSNMAGVNLSKPEITRKTELYIALQTGKIKNLPNTVWNNIENGITNMISKLYR